MRGLRLQKRPRGEWLRVNSCWSSGGPEWLFPALLGAGAVAAICFFAVLRLDDGPVRSPRVSVGRSLLPVVVVMVAWLTTGDWGIATMMLPASAAFVLSVWAMRDLSWDYAAAGPHDYAVPLSDRGRSARRLLIATAIVGAAATLAIVFAMTVLGEPC